MKTKLMLLLILALKHAEATEFEPKGKAIAAALGTKQAFKKSVNVDGKAVDVFYSKDSKGKAAKYAIVETGLYEPNCTHTWVMGINAKTAALETIRVVEMSCPHAFPTKTNSFLGQYTGKGPADMQKLDSDIQVVAKATGTCQLTTDAVKRSVSVASKIKGQF